VLRDADLVLVCKRAQQRIYEVNPDRMAEFEAWLAPHWKLWNERLDVFGDPNIPESGHAGTILVYDPPRRLAYARIARPPSRGGITTRLTLQPECPPGLTYRPAPKQTGTRGRCQ